MFEKASRQKLRFESTKGVLSVEDLWDLPLTSQTGKANLDEIARQLYKKVKESTEISFVKPTAEDSESQQKLEIVKHIIDVRLREAEAASQARIKAETKQKILEIMDRKKDEALSNASLEELQVRLNSL